MLVSVYLPTRNRRDLLVGAVRSVLNQSYRQIELLVVDDGSTDDTRCFLEGVGATDARVRILRNESPSGAPHSRNAAILAARGDFVTGLDDDDQFLPDRIAAFVSYWHLLASISQPVSFLYSQEIVEGPGSAVSVSRKPGSADYNAMFRSNAVGNQIFAPKEAFIEAGLFDAQMPAWQDLDMFMRILKRRGPARLLDVPLYRLNLQPRSDRISRQSKATLYSAYTRLAKKCVGATAAMKQELFLQLFEEYYGFSPRLQDVFEFAKYGVKQGNNLRFLKLILRRSLHLR